MQIELVTIPPPGLDPAPANCPTIPVAEYELRAAMLLESAGTDWVIVYGDREHTGNLAWACGFDPRFEEALLVLGPDARRFLLLGNEGMGYTSAAILPVEPVLCQSLSLPGQPRDAAPRLFDVLKTIGIGTGQRIGVVGWKYLEAAEDDDTSTPAFVPALLVRVLERLVGAGGVVRDVTAVVQHPSSGLALRNSAAQIAAYAWAAERASAYVLRIARGARPGMSEYEAAALMGYQGDPFSCHVMMVSASGPVVGLRSPSARVLASGDGVTTAIGLRGGLSCRAGLLRDTPDEAFMAGVVTPYYRAIATWWQTLRIGVTGGAVHDAVLGTLAGASFKPALNPGHLTGIEEWTHSPIRAGSSEPITSGMMFQCDIIPAPLPAGQTLNCEDTAVVADANLRAALQAFDPALWERITARQTFMRTALGIAVPDELLPLSLAPAYLAPFWLMNDTVCRVVKKSR